MLLAVCRLLSAATCCAAASRRSASSDCHLQAFFRKFLARRGLSIIIGATAPPIVTPTAAASVPTAAAPPIVAPTAAAMVTEEVRVYAAALDSSNVPMQACPPTAMPESPNTRWWREFFDNPTKIDPSVLEAALDTAAAVPPTTDNNAGSNNQEEDAILQDDNVVEDSEQWLDGPFLSTDESVVASPPRLADNADESTDGDMHLLMMNCLWIQWQIPNHLYCAARHVLRQVCQ